MFKFTASLIILLTCHLSAQAVNFYVSTTGNNTNPGTQAQPWRTIQYAGDHATPGSAVYIMAGTYTEQIYMNVSGTAGNYITFTHFANDVVIVDGGSTNTQIVLLTIADQRYLRIQGLRFANAVGNFSIGIEVTGNADHIDLLDNEIYNIHFSSNPNAAVTPGTNVNPLIIYGAHATLPIHSIVISGNTIHDCRTGYSEALTLTGNVDTFSVTGNTVHDITNIGIDLAGGYGVCPTPPLDAARNGVVANNLVYNCVSNYAVAAGIYADGSRDIVIEHNEVHDCGRGYEIGCEQPGKIADHLILRDNVAWHNREAAIGIGGYDYPSTGRVRNSKVLNNTCYDNVWTNNGDGELLIEYTENCVIENNLFYATNAAKYILTAALNSVGLTLNYNLYYHSAGSAAVKVDWNGTGYTGFSIYKNATGRDVNSVFGNPLLAAPATHDFHLNTGSPAYNTGDPAFVAAAGETDLDGNARILLGRVDIGVDEAAVALPVEYVAPLSGYARPPQGIVLHWATATEANLDRFDVERSRDGQSFEKIGEAAPLTHINPTKNYTFLDKKPAVGMNYYRLSEFDRDGKIAKSNIVEVAYTALEVQVYPNPATDIFTIKSNTDWDRAVLRNATGQVVREFSRTEQPTLAGLENGAYWLEIYGKEGDLLQLAGVWKE